MATDTGYNHDNSWTFAKDDGGTDWDDDALADGATETSNTAISQDGKAGTIITVEAVEDNTGAIDGNVTIHILGDIDGTIFEEPGVAGARQASFTPVQNDTVSKVIAIPGWAYDDFKIAIENQSGQELAISVRYKQSSIPVAS